ncbi:MAG: hypothetical protein H0W81_10085 [Chloroflexi bacterium]|nr:hypothetical protein [Chloroflexota bacterium]
MSASHDAIARHYPAGNPRIALYLAIPLLLALLAIGIASAEVPPGITRVSAADAERTGSAIHLTKRPVGGSTLVEVETSTTGMSLLAVSADGSEVALADQLGEASGSLTLAEMEGEQLRIAMPGLLAASFASDGTWLAVIDGRGALWRVDGSSGRNELLGEGPFIGSPIIQGDGSLLVLAVPSVEAPYQSRLVRLQPATGTLTRLSEEELVYAVFPLDDGDLAIVAHEAGGTVVRRLAGVGKALLADLGIGAVNVAVAANGRIAFERTGEGIYVVDPTSTRARRLGAGSRPCFGPDGSSLLVRRGDQSLALDADGSVLAVSDEPAAFAASAGCLP